MAKENNREIKVIWNLQELAQAVAGLPVEGRLPARTVLVSSERAAHCLRKELIREEQENILIGTRFLGWGAAAAEVLSEAGISFRAGEEGLRPARLREVFKNPPKLKYFKKDLLTATPGWDAAFAFTIEELEGARVGPKDGAKFAEDERLQDVFSLWQRVEKQAGDSWTMSRIFDEAARLLEKNPSSWPFSGPVLLPINSEMSMAQAAFAKAIPNSIFIIWGTRPVREQYLERMEGLFGPEARQAVESAECPRASGSELAILTSYLFEKPEILADPKRPRSNKIDNTVHFEEYSGVEDEIGAAADWIGRQVYGESVPLSEIAVLVPSIDPWASLLVERINRLPHAADPVPVFVAGGLPITSTSGGVRVLRVLRALSKFLPAEIMAEVLPTLRLEPDEQKKHLSRKEAIELLCGLGTAGGSIARREDALAWRAGLERAKEITAVDPDPNSEDSRAFRDKKKLVTLALVRPAFFDLQGIAEAVIGGAKLPIIWERMKSFWKNRLLIPDPEKGVIKNITDSVEMSLADSFIGELRGEEALGFLLESIKTLRLPAGRFGDPAVYIGTVPSAGALSFRAVRMIGLAEGNLPSSVREDPVIPDEIRKKNEDLWLPPAEVRSLAQLHAFDRALRTAGQTLVLSAPRQDLDRTRKELSSVFMEAAAALGRPGKEKDASESVFDLKRIRRNYILPARVYREEFRESNPLSAADWHDLAARGERPLPASWDKSGHLDLLRVTRTAAAS
jgi:hypothetical protein